MSFQNLLEAVKHNSMFTHRYEGMCQCCGKLFKAEQLNSFTPVNTRLYIENEIGGDILYCDECKKFEGMYNNLFQFYNLVALDIKCSHKGLKIPRSDGSESDVEIENAVAIFSKKQHKLFIKFKFLNLGHYVFKAITTDKFIKANKELMEKEDFKLTISFKKLEVEKIISESKQELTDDSIKLYENYKQLFENKVLDELKTAFVGKLDIIYV